MNCTATAREFQCNCLLIKALLQYLSAAERKKVHEWLEKLQQVGDTLPDAQIRNEYTGYLLLNVQNGRLQTPFNLFPSCGKLRPLARVLTDHTYEDAMRQLNGTFCMTKNEECEDEPQRSAMPLSTNPNNFRDEQPTPRKGIIAHCSAFSSYQE